MIDRLIWKVVLLLGGIIGVVYSFPKFINACTAYEGAYSASDKDDFQSQILIYGLLCLALFIAFIVGCFITANTNQESISESCIISEDKQGKTLKEPTIDIEKLEALLTEGKITQEEYDRIISKYYLGY